MLQLRNESPFEATFFILPDPQGVDTLFVVTKATFDVGTKIRLAKTQLPIALADKYRGEPSSSSVTVVGEAHPAKPGTDVIVIGDAWAPDARLAYHVDAGVHVAGRQQTARVYGDRVWKGLLSLRPSHPEPFVRMPLIYERAYGGRYVDETGFVSEHGENPVGRGYRGRRSRRDFLGTALPNIEDLGHLVRSVDDVGRTVGFGPVSPSWLPRRTYAGTYDARWQKITAPYLPNDFDTRYLQVAPPNLTFPKPLGGGEPVVLINLAPTSRLAFSLPKCHLDVEVDIAGRREQPESWLDLVCIEPNDERMALSWRTALPCDKQILKIDGIRISLKEFTGA